jgi:biopolymer transport protein ExbD
MAKKVPELNAGTMADIAFLLLIFFLVTTTMDSDTGIIRVLPPPLDKNIDPPKVKDRNIMKVLINSRDKLLINGKQGNINTLRAEVIDFMTPHAGDLPEYPETKMETIKNLGDVPVSKGLISLKNDRGTSYKMYINVQDELVAAFHKLRDELSKEKFGQVYDKLPLEEQKKAIEKAVPLRISEAEPGNVGDR